MKNKGFSLVEMLVAVSILMIIMLMSVPTLTGMIQGQNQKQAIGNLQALIAAENSYFSLYNQYPTSLSVLSTCGSTVDALHPCLLSSALTGSTPINGYQVSDQSSNSGYFISVSPVTHLQGAIYYCAESSLTTPDGLVRGIWGAAPTKDSCLTEPVVTNSGQGPAGPPGPMNVVQLSKSGNPIAVGGTEQLNFTIPSGQYVLGVKVNYTFSNATVTKEWISCTLGTGTSTQLDSSYNQHTYTAEQYSGGYVPLTAVTYPSTTQVFVFCTNNGSSAPIYWGVIGTATQITSVATAQ